jgi:hypothetical protein
MKLVSTRPKRGKSGIHQIALSRRLRRWGEVLPRQSALSELLQTIEHPSACTGQFVLLAAQLMQLRHLFTLTRFVSDIALDAMREMLALLKTHPHSKSNRNLRANISRMESMLRRLMQQKQKSFSLDLWFEMFVCKIVDVFELYLYGVLRQCLKKNPRAISEASITVQDLLNLKDIDDAIKRIVEDKVDRESFFGLPSIADFLEKRFGVGLDRTGERYRKMLEVIEVRHLIVHRDSKVSRRFVEKTNRREYKEGDRFPIDADYVSQAMMSARGLALDLEGALKQKGVV